MKFFDDNGELVGLVALSTHKKLLVVLTAAFAPSAGASTATAGTSLTAAPATAARGG